MAISPTRYSRVSIGFVSSTKSIVDVDAGDTGAVFSVTGPAAYTGDQTVTGAATISSTLSVGGNFTATAGAFIGTATAINEIVAFSSATAAVSLGAINPLESSSVQTVALSGATRGDTLMLTVDSIYPNAAANRDVTWMCSSSSTAGEVHVWGVNSTLTAVTPTAATVIRLSRINHPSYL